MQLQVNIQRIAVTRNQKIPVESVPVIMWASIKRCLLTILEQKLLVIRCQIILVVEKNNKDKHAKRHRPIMLTIAVSNIAHFVAMVRLIGKPLSHTKGSQLHVETLNGSSEARVLPLAVISAVQ